MSKNKKDVQKLCTAICLIQKSLTCSICLGVCFKPYTPRCGHPFCQQCIIKVMMKCSVQCPVCNGILTRRTLIQNNHLSSIIIFLYKIEHAIKTDINLEIADYETFNHNNEFGDENILRQIFKIQDKNCSKTDCLKSICNMKKSKSVNVSELNENILEKVNTYIEDDNLTLTKDFRKQSSQVLHSESVISAKRNLVGNIIPFQKLGKMVKKQKRIPFFYFGRLSKSPGKYERGNDLLPTRSQCSKDFKPNFVIADSSYSGFSKTTENVISDKSKINNCTQSSHPAKLAILGLVSPQSDSPTIRLTIDTLKRQREVLNSRKEINSTQKESNFLQIEKYKKFLDDVDFNISSEQFQELEDLDLLQSIENNASVKTDKLKEKKEEKEFSQNLINNSFVQYSLSEFLTKSPICTIQSNSINIESEELANHFFGDVIEKSKGIRKISCTNALTDDEEKFTQVESDLILFSQNITKQNINKELSIEETTRESCDKTNQLFYSPTKAYKVTKEKEQSPTHNENASYTSEKESLATLSNSSMNISQEQIMLAEFEKQLFGVKNFQEKDTYLFSDDLKQGRPQLNSNDVDLKGTKLPFSKHIKLNTGMEINPFSQVGVKRKSYPLYHSTPKVLKLKDESQNFLAHSGINTLNISTSLHNNYHTPKVIEKLFEEKETLSFVCSGLSPPQIKIVKQLSDLVNANFISTFNSTVTHVIVKVSGQRNTTEKTLKYLQGIAYGKWIVSLNWVYDSLQEKKLLNEENYEIVDNLTSEEGPKKSRLREKNIFEEFVCLCQGPFNDVSVAEYTDLLIHMGATTVHTIEDFTDYKNNKKIIILQSDHWNERIIREWFESAKAVPVEQEWLVECISQYKVISLFDYLQAISPEEAATVGFPEGLLREEYECRYED